MKLCMLHASKGPQLAAYRDGQYVDLHSVFPGLTVQDVIDGRAGVADQVSAAIAAAPLCSNQQVRLEPPISRPPKIVCVGLNYIDHAKETDQPIPSEPLIFCKLPSALRGPGQAIQLPKVSDQVDYEAELVVVIGRAGRDIVRGDAMNHVAGYMCGHDVSARDWQKQKPGGQWLLGKSFDTFAPRDPGLSAATKSPIHTGCRFGCV